MLLIDRPLPRRVRLTPEQVTPFHHGQDWILGLPWTHLVLLLPDLLMLIRPFPFSRPGESCEQVDSEPELNPARARRSSGMGR